MHVGVGVFQRGCVRVRVGVDGVDGVCVASCGCSVRLFLFSSLFLIFLSVFLSSVHRFKCSFSIVFH